jgi:hypothetical protein
MKTYCYFIIALFFQNIFSQKNIILIDKKSQKPIVNAILKNCNLDSVYKSISNTDGLIKLNNFNKDSTCIEISHVNYGKQKIIINRVIADNDTIFLNEKIFGMDEIVLEAKKTNKLYLKHSLMRFFINYRLSLGHNQKVAQIIYKKEYKKKISKIKVQIIDGLGVKNLKYLPFKVSIYNVDSLTQKPNQCIYISESIKKNNNKKWVYIDVESLNLFSNDQDLFLVFETLRKEDYSVEYISSKAGYISAVPMIKAEIYTPKNKIKCYINSYDYIEELYKWEFIECQLFFDFVYEK